MSGVALATFVSCNKAGAAHQYAEYLNKKPNDYEARFKKAYCHEILQDFAQASEEYREIASRARSKCVRAVANALALATDGGGSMVARIESTKALNTATRDYNGSSLAWHYLGESLRLQGEFKNAIDAFEKAAARNESDMWNKTLLAETLREHGLEQTDDINREHYRKKAKTQYREVVNSSQYPVTLAHAGLALCHLADGEVDDAKKQMKIAHETNPKLIPTPDPKKYREMRVEQECLAEIARSEVEESSYNPLYNPTRRIGASGKPMLYFVMKPNWKEAEEAAQDEGKGNTPIHHSGHKFGQRSHFHATDKSGEIIKNGIHFLH